MKKSSLLFIAVLALAACGTPDKGDDGKAGASSLVRLDAEAEGDNCPNGGTAIVSGVDANGDGVLGNDEVTSTRYACNGAGKDGDNGTDGTDGTDGLQAIVRLETEAPGDNCEFGGTRVSSGLGNDGEFANEDAVDVAYVCNGVGAGESSIWDGDYDVYSAADALALRGIGHVTGSLRIFDVGGAKTLEFASLVQIDGDLTVKDTTLVGLSFPRLSRVGENVLIDSNDSLVSLTVPSLRTVGGVFYVVQNNAITSLELLELRAVGTVVEGDDNTPASAVGELRLKQNSVLTSVSAPELVSVAGALNADTNEALVSLDLEALATVGGFVEVLNNKALVSVRLGALATVGKHLKVYENEALTSLTLDALDTLGGDFWVETNKSLTSLSVNTLETTHGAFLAYDNAVLATLSVDMLTSVSGFFVVDGQPLLTSVVANALESADEIYVLNNPELTSLSMNALRHVPTRFEVEQNPKLPYCQAWGIWDALEAPKPAELTLSGLDESNISDCLEPS